jgi:hypothetical protein
MRTWLDDISDTQYAELVRACRGLGLSPDAWPGDKAGDALKWAQTRKLIFAELAYAIVRKESARPELPVTLMSVMCTHPKLPAQREHIFREKLKVRSCRLVGWQYRDRIGLHTYPASAPNANGLNYAWNCPRCPEHLCLTTNNLDKVVSAVSARAIEDAAAGVRVPGQRAKLDISEAQLLLSSLR